MSAVLASSFGLLLGQLDDLIALGRGLDASNFTAGIDNLTHLHTVDEAGMEAWYEKAFGFTVTKVPMLTSKNLQVIGEVPGTSLHFATEKTALAPTKGRALDHIGFDVKDLEAFTKKLEAQGIKLDEAIRLAPNGTTKVAYLTDPWGTRIELTEKLAPAAN